MKSVKKKKKKCFWDFPGGSLVENCLPMQGTCVESLVRELEIPHADGKATWQDRETVETVADLILGGSKITVDGDFSHEIKRRLLLGRKADQPRQYIKKQRHDFANEGLSSQGYGFSSGHVWM